MKQLSSVSRRKHNESFTSSLSSIAMRSSKPFFFRRRRDRINWRMVAAFDITRIQQESDAAALQDVIDNVTFCDVETEDLRLVDPNFIKLFQLSQLIIEYLLYCQNVLQEAEISAKTAASNATEELAKTKQTAEKQLLEIYALRKERRSMKKTIYAYQIMSSVPKESEQKKLQCRYCSKLFSSEQYLDAHVRRRHCQSESSTRNEVMTECDHDPRREEILCKLSSTMDQLGQRLADTEAGIRQEIEQRASKELQERAREMTEQMRNELEAKTRELESIKSAFALESSREREILAGERQVLERLRLELLEIQKQQIEQKTRVPESRLGNFEDDVVSEAEQRIKEANTNAIEEMRKVVANELTSFREQLSKTVQENGAKSQELKSVKEINTFNKEQNELKSVEEISTINKEQNELKSVKEISTINKEKSINETRQFIPRVKSKQSVSSLESFDNKEPLDEWPLLSKHLRTHKYVSLSHAPWVKSAMSHPIVAVMKAREAEKESLRRVLHKLADASALQDPQKAEELSARIEEKRNEQMEQDACYGPMFECIYDQMEEIVAQHFRFKPKPALLRAKARARSEPDVVRSRRLKSPGSERRPTLVRAATRAAARPEAAMVGSKPEAERASVYPRRASAMQNDASSQRLGRLSIKTGETRKSNENCSDEARETKKPVGEPKTVSYALSEEVAERNLSDWDMESL